MKVRIGIGIAGAHAPDDLEGLCRALLEHRFDSIWIPEILTQPGLDPMVALAWLSGRLPALKVGTTFLLPKRNVLRLARQLATLDQLSGGRLLLTGVPGLAKGPESVAVGALPSTRGALIDESLPLLKRLLDGEATDVPSDAGVARSVVLDPPSRQRPLEIWLGGMVPSSLDRCGRLGDGWLPAMCTPAQAAAGRRRIEEVAAEAGRAIDPEHYGVSIGYAAAPLDDGVRRALQARAKTDDLTAIVPQSLEELHDLLCAYLEVGFSKFVVRPLVVPTSWGHELEELAEAVGALQN